MSSSFIVRCSLFSALPLAFFSNVALANQMLVNHSFTVKCEEQFGKAGADDIGFKAVAVKSISRMEGKLGTDHAKEDDPKAAANIDTVRGALTLRTVAELKDKYDALADILQVCRVKNAWNAPPMKRKEAFHYCVGEHGAASQFVLFVCVFVSIFCLLLLLLSIPAFLLCFLVFTGFFFAYAPL
jgi:hypothetical protein